MSNINLIRGTNENKRAADLAYEITQLLRKNRAPFHYTGCCFVLQDVEDEFEGFIPDLNTWSMDIAGLAGQTYGIQRWSEEKIREVQGLLSLSFFDKHPEYRVLERFITEADAPDLYRDLKLCEEVRKKLLEIVSCIIAEGK